MKSIYFLFFFSLIIFISYKYAYKIYYKDKIIYEIKYLLLPQSYYDSFTNQYLVKSYKNIFDNKSISNNYTKENNL
jgi:hypothetical protein